MLDTTDIPEPPTPIEFLITSPSATEPHRPASTSLTRFHQITELRDVVADLISDDKLSLRNCSLSCRAWSSSARPVLFRRISLSVYNTRGSENIFEDFHAFLQSNPTSLTGIGSFVKELNFLGRLPQFETVLFTRRKGSYTFIPISLIAALLRLLPRLRALELSTLIIDSDLAIDGSLQRPRYRFENFTLKNISVRAGRSLQDAFNIFRLFSSISSLKVDRVERVLSPTEDADLHSYEFPQDLSIMSIAISGGETPRVLRGMARTAMASSLSSLDMVCSQPEHTQPLGEILHKVGPRLITLSLDLSLMDITHNGSLSLLHLSSSSSLETLSLIIPLARYVLHRAEAAVSEGFTFLSSMLSQVSPSTIRTVRIVFEWRCGDENVRQGFQQIDWTSLQKSVANFEGLKLLQVRRQGIWSLGPKYGISKFPCDLDEELKSVLKGRLADLDRKGVLIVDGFGSNRRRG